MKTDLPLATLLISAAAGFFMWLAIFHVVARFTEE